MKQLILLFIIIILNLSACSSITSCEPETIIYRDTIYLDTVIIYDTIILKDTIYNDTLYKERKYGQTVYTDITNGFNYLKAIDVYTIPSEHDYNYHPLYNYYYFTTTKYKMIFKH